MMKNLRVPVQWPRGLRRFELLLALAATVSCTRDRPRSVVCEIDPPMATNDGMDYPHNPGDSTIDGINQLRGCRMVRWVSSFKRVRGVLPVSPSELLDPSVATSDLRPHESGLTDAWAHQFHIEASGTGFRVRSAGPDALFSTADDITFSPRGP